SFEGFGRATIGADAERVVAVDLHQIGGLVKNVGDGLVVHARTPERNCNVRERYSLRDRRSRQNHRLNKKPNLVGWVFRTYGERPYCTLVTFLQALVAFDVDRTVVHEHVRTTILTAYKAKAFRVIEPLYGPFQSHSLLPPGRAHQHPHPEDAGLELRQSG